MNKITVNIERRGFTVIFHIFLAGWRDLGDFYPTLDNRVRATVFAYI